ncbi:DMT family transporter [Wenyingzhuangia marina]|uniref:EamA domain-containing membrane protein RarD n=1 Tax=Wenyingzhuangia marina TaxID=1195760 RepID=A0A1M5T1P7_9FLAO|nr:DMT family transporter [Wenyingzhuangia marina]GGF65007.1 membrane protein [Wenyingzhuangia marina]SHH44550.1 EamA domain-containing membrane protein RarD [Wenyingzhuangia marina]
MKSSKAIFYMILSVIAFSLMNTVVKYLNDFSAYQIVFFRSIGTLCFTIPLILKNKIPFFGNNKKWLLLRGVAGVISLTCFFQSLNYLSLGTAVSLRYTSPIFAAIFALMFLKEKVKPIQWFLFLIAFVGVLIIKGFGVDVNSIGIIFAILSALFLGLIFVLIRKIGDSENSLVIINYFMVMAFVFGGLMSINHWTNPNLLEWLLLLSLGVFGYVGQLYLTKAFQSYETNVIAPLKYLEVVFMILIGTFWYQETYNIWTLLGVLLIMVSLIYNVYLKRKKS